jgi:hypothetical protein
LVAGQETSSNLSAVIAGLDPAIHRFDESLP